MYSMLAAFATEVIIVEGERVLVRKTHDRQTVSDVLLLYTTLDSFALPPHS
tara:strand:- start:307 stop:459 length:153 start_codon:yes stop_codon:yes gene_type:complete